MQKNQLLLKVSFQYVINVFLSFRSNYHYFCSRILLGVSAALIFISVSSQKPQHRFLTGNEEHKVYYITQMC